MFRTPNFERLRPTWGDVNLRGARPILERDVSVSNLTHQLGRSRAMCWETFGQFVLAKSASCDIHQFWHDVDQFVGRFLTSLPCLGVGPRCVELECSIVEQTLSKSHQRWSGQLWSTRSIVPTFGRVRANIGPMRPNLGRLWPISGEV